MKKLMKVAAVEGRMQPNFEAFDAGVRRFVGRRFDPTLGELDASGEAQGGFVIVPDGEMVPVRAEYIQALKQGDLMPADEESARVSGVKLPESE